jgi:hypothetical protein
MRPMQQDPQESRTDTVSAAVTAQEKWCVQLVKKKTGRDISDLLRDHSLNDLIEMGKRLDEALDRLPADAGAVG